MNSLARRIALILWAMFSSASALSQPSSDADPISEESVLEYATAPFMTPERAREKGVSLRDPAGLMIAPPCQNQPVRVMGTFYARPVPEIVVAEVLLDDNFLWLNECE